MADTELLKYARIQNDYPLQARTSAAMFVQALYWLEAPPPDLSVEGRAMVEWVIDNPLQPVELMGAFVATMPEVVATAKLLEPGGVDTSEVLDEHIKYQVGAKWNTVALQRFAAAA